MIVYLIAKSTKNLRDMFRESYTPTIVFYIIDDYISSDLKNTTPTELLGASQMAFDFNLETNTFRIRKNKFVGPDERHRHLAWVATQLFGVEVDPETLTFVNQKDLTFFLLSYQKYLDKQTELAHNLIVNTNKE